jgi:hypothetical protein
MNLPALRPFLVATSLALLAGCVAPVGPVEVTRFHVPDAAAATQATIRVEPGPGMDSQSIEFRAYAAAVTRELQRLGYTVAPRGNPAAVGTAQVALLSIERRSFDPDRPHGPVSVGVGGSTGGYGSGVGVGLGIDLTPRPGEQVATEMRVSIRERAGQRALWEGRANFTVPAKSPLAATDLGAARLAEALFKDWPGRSGETIEVE